MKTASLHLGIRETYADCRSALRTALESTSQLPGPGSRILLKINMMKGSEPEARQATHPAFVAALVEVCRENGAHVTVADSSGVLGFTEEAMEASGMRAAVERAGGHVASLDAGPFRMVPFAHAPRGEVAVSELLFEADTVLQVPKLKTHTLMELTGATKCLVGVLPGATKCDLHLAGRRPLELADVILDLWQSLEDAGVPLGGAVLDGIQALAGRGPGVGPVPRNPGLIVAGRDPLLVDLGTAWLVGFAPETVPCSSPRCGEVCCGRTPYATAGKAPIRTRPGSRSKRPRRAIGESTAWLTHASYFVRGHALTVRHDRERCESHGKCMEVCPVDCIHVEGDGLSIGEACIRCFACHSVCPTGAMTLHVPFPLRGVFRKRAEGLDTSKLS